MSKIFVASVVSQSLFLSSNSTTVIRIEKTFSIQIETFQSAKGVIAVRTFLVETVIFGIMVVEMPEPLVLAFAFKTMRTIRKYS